MNQEIKIGIYKHAKTGNEYRVVCLAKHSETLEDLVVYEALYKNEESKFWVRPAYMFKEVVVINGVETSRFI
ncbi:MAG: DUF1653 domain-containing protein [Candidatus Yonathbacteria bacterium]|nr:DUF1653 domain-containing protein [Candidatus Yonathbacteria bacterium]